MKVVILAGGLGTRFREETEFKPKPMIEIGNIPILLHIIKYYEFYGHQEFIIAGGYKVNIIKDYFSKFHIFNSNVEFQINSNSVNLNILNFQQTNIKVTVIDTGENTKTAERILKLQNLIGEETFMCTYGDGLSNVNLNKLVEFHNKNNSLATITTTKPQSRFGILKLSGDKVLEFIEKPEVDYWVNCGFFVFNHEIFNYLKTNQMLEEEPFQKISKENKMVAFKHDGFWHPMDTYRDWSLLQKLWVENNSPWKVW